MQRVIPRLLGVLLGLLIGLGGEVLCCAETNELQYGFEDEQTSWQVRLQAHQARTLIHQRTKQNAREGLQAEFLQIQTRPNAVVQLEHALPAARVIDELKLSLWVRTNLPGVQMYLRVVFPHLTDPSTGQVLTALIPGTQTSQSTEWTKLECEATGKNVREQIYLLRNRLNNPQIEGRDLYIDQVVLAMSPEAGTWSLILDELHWGPVISPRPGTQIIPASHEEQQSSRVTFRLDQLLVDDRPYFPRFTSWHGESPETLRQLGFNSVWIPDYQNTALIQQLEQAGIGIIATPPGLPSQQNGTPESGLLPFTSATAPILFWYTGTRIPPQAREDLIAWNEQIRNADRRFQRPIMADITGMERVISRHIPLLGMSRHALGSDFQPKQYRNWLLFKRKLARPGTFTWTWIQTVPDFEQNQSRIRRGQHPLVVEPEQIRLQAYASLAAGCRGIGFWKSQSLQSDDPVARERNLIISQLNRELALIEPFLATGTLDGQVEFEVKVEAPNISRSRLDFRNSAQQRAEQLALAIEREHQLERQKLLKTELEAAIIRGEHATLLLPVWYETNAQFVPGQLAANDAEIVVSGIYESASAWEITTTRVRSLPRERVAGGIKITLSKFDQTACVLLTSDRDLIAKIQAQVQEIAPLSAQEAIELATAKLDRVTQIDQELNQLGFPQPDGAAILSRARVVLTYAQASHRRGEYDEARQYAENCMQLLRILQRAHWHTAVRKLSSPVSSPHTLCFQTLPDHYKLINQLGRGTLPLEDNLLRSGNFEDIDTMVVEKWPHRQGDLPDIRIHAALYPSAYKGNYSLRLEAGWKPGASPTQAVDDRPVQITTPPLPVRAGQILLIRGWVKVVAAPQGNPDGATIYDSLGGMTHGLRFYQQGDWEPFQMIREVPESGSFRLTFSLNAVGIVQFDEIEVIPFQPSPVQQVGTLPPQPPPMPPRETPPRQLPAMLQPTAYPR